jgi:hypothetical protein
MAEKKSADSDPSVPAEGFPLASRRQFLKTAIVASALPMVAGAAADSAAAAVRPRALPLYKVIFDERFAESRAFADRARNLGLTAQAIKADVTALWFNDLHGRWRAGPAAIAGLTEPSALFCLERLAWDHGMRVLFHAEHRHFPNGAIDHTVLNGDDLLRPGELGAARAGWSERIAELLARYPAERHSRASVTAAGLARSANENSTTLVSWLIAPIDKI